MDRAAIIKHWSVIEAFRNGKTIQWKTSYGWEDVDNPSFQVRNDYRVKPEKKEMWVNVYSYYDIHTKGYAYATRVTADERTNKNRIACVKVVYEEGEGL